MILINWTKLEKFYWTPEFEHKHDGATWYYCVRFLGVEVAVYSNNMATAMIRTLNEKDLAT